MGLTTGRQILFVFVAALGAAGCGSPPDGGGPDMHLDCVANPAMCGCTVDADCGGGATPRCDVKTGSCVPCLPTADNCPAQQRCVASGASYACRPDCKGDVDCPKADSGAVTSCCDHACIDEDSDPMHCGACGKTCAALPNAQPGCAMGACALGACKVGFADCDTKSDNGCEINTATDAKNCGACGTVCPPAANGAAACVAGKCTINCTAGYSDCNKDLSDGCESQTATDVKNCGTCGMACGALPNANIACAAGVCGIGSCMSGFGDCNKKPADGCEVDTQSDIANCNACGHDCTPGHGVGQCMAGRCSIATCNMGYTDCDGVFGDGCEIATGTDPDNCGMCGHQCVGARSMQACMAGTCSVTSCDPGWADCDLKPANGCESPVSGDVMNCGACNKVCPVPQNAVPTCVNSMCGLGGCKMGFADCNNDPNDGCEADFSTPLTCGACNVKCPTPQNATPGCNMGACGVGVCNMSFGDCNMNAADGCEKNLGVDVANCGACGHACVTPNAVPQCGGGVCSIMMCAQGFSDCDMMPGDGCESHTAVDPANCGGCGKPCPGAPNSMPTCANSKCGLACSFGFADCNGVGNDGCEINLKIDVANCGSCMHGCPAVANGTAGCSAGACGIASCNMLWGDCNGSQLDGCERNLGADIGNCGACGQVCVTPNANPACLNGQCGIASCGIGFSDCDGNWATGCEVPTRTDPMNCGGCKMVCPGAPNAAPSCANSQCGLACTMGFADCDHMMGNGCEVDTRTDVANCNACGAVCAPAHATPSCMAGVCSIAQCNNLFGDCNKNAGDGCERSLAADLGNCGACGQVCSAAHATAQCLNGVCGVGMCNVGFADCNGLLGDGCEVATAGDANNCGGCNIVCPGAPNAAATCVNSQCGLACAQNFADCDHMAGNGCEVDIRSDIGNCSGCGSVCAPANAAPACMAGVCSIAQCNNLFGDCNKNAGDGCERPLASDINNCGACGKVCVTPNATPVCQAGSCNIGSCTAGFSDCNGLIGDGCERATSADVNNCGGCNIVCPGAPNATPSCVNSKCTLACSQGFADCDHVAGNGCEANLLLDVNNCNGCGSVCAPANAAPVCNQGACQIMQCNNLFGDCNASAGDGCERNLTSDAANCGSCGKVCVTPNATPQCANGACAIGMCSPGFSDCNGLIADGCESTTGADPMNCGGCGTVCPGGANATATCTNSKCGLTCTAGYGDCDGNLVNGCEVNLKSDLANCNACGTPCAPANATPSCSAGVCSIQACSGTWLDCNNSVADGCEKDVGSDTFNCGSCGKICDFPNSRAGCANGQCNIAICKAGWVDCDGQLANGCEAFTPGDPKNCGGCGTVCPVNLPYCSKGLCSAAQAVVGQFFVDSGPASGTNPATVTCQEACANLFGGTNTIYSCSTSNAMITHTAWLDGYNDQHCTANPLAENFKKNATYSCGVFQCSYSAYVKDHSPTCHVLNYCYR